MRAFRISLMAIALVVHSAHLFAQSKKTDATAPAGGVTEGWDEIDERLVFLIVRLANTETSLDAVESAIIVNNRKMTTKKADLANAAADKKLGGPLKWSKFYALTADKFFYHPAGRSSTYHTTKILSPGSQVEVDATDIGSARPPKFDDITRANQKAKSKVEADVSAIQNSSKLLTDRRNRLEAQQAALWIEIAFRAVEHFDLNKKPVYRFEPIADIKEHADAMKAAGAFMATALSIATDAENDQALTFNKLKPMISLARQELTDAWLRAGIESPDKKTNQGRFVALAKRLEDVASNLAESYAVATERGNAKDQQRKDTFRGTFQESLIDYAETILALDEMCSAFKDEWRTKSDPDRPLTFVTMQSVMAEGEAEAIAKRKEFAGKYHVLNAKGGTIFTITLEPLGNSQTTNGAGGTGKWEVVEGTIRITWFEDWKDIIRNEGTGYRKYGLKPGESWIAKPHEVLSVKRIPLDD